MNTPFSFLGKCFTILMGIALSWATVTNPEIDSLASAFVGAASQDVVSDLAPLADSPPFAASAEAIQHQDDVATSLPAVSSNDALSAGAESNLQPTSGQRIEKISLRLKQLGATYLLLEKLPQPNGVQYRARCDLADQRASLKCCFEAIRDTALDAMEEVLRSAQLNAAKVPFSGPTVASSI